MIRKVRHEDIPKCVEVIKKSFQTVADEFGITQENAPRFTAFATTEERLLWHFDGEHRPMYVFCDNEMICGYYSLYIEGNGECELNNLAVLPEYRHKGIGKCLFGHAVKTAKEMGCNTLNIGIVEENTVLRKWYEKSGAIHIGTQKFDFFPFTCGYMKKEHLNMANFITSCRIMCSAVLLFFPTFSVEFYIVYCLAGLTDMIDGTVARKTGTVSRFGSILDTAADIVFTAVCLMKILPVLDIALWLWIWIAAIAGIKVINVIAGFIVQKSFTAQHTVLNKITGAVLFVLPLTLSFVELSYSASVVCAVATIAALHEGYLVIFKKDKSKTRQT